MGRSSIGPVHPFFFLVIFAWAVTNRLIFWTSLLAQKLLFGESRVVNAREAVELLCFLVPAGACVALLVCWLLISLVRPLLTIPWSKALIKLAAWVLGMTVLLPIIHVGHSMFSIEVRPVILGVSSISTRANQTITIRGINFGTAPHLVPIGEGFVDTLKCNSKAPSIRLIASPVGIPGTILAAPGTGWFAGQAQCGNIDPIGIKLVSWSDSKVILAGLGPASGHGKPEWRLAPGSQLQITIYGSNGMGLAVFNTVVQARDSGPPTPTK